MEEVLRSLRVLAKIADAYDDNALDDEARKVWGENDQFTNQKHPSIIELYSGRGGRQLLTLQDCLDARNALKEFEAYLGRKAKAKTHTIRKSVLVNGEWVDS